MNTKHFYYFASAVAVGFLLADTLKSKPGFKQAYAHGLALSTPK